MPLKELKIEFTSELTDLKYPDNLGKRSKLGGVPLWIQDNETIFCPSCKKEMDFVCQLDSIDYTGFLSPNAEYMFGDVGMIYTFFCFNCNTVESRFQSY